MNPRRLLYLDNQRLTAHAWQRGKLAAEGVFEMRSEEFTRFTDYLRAHRNSQFQKRGTSSKRFRSSRGPTARR